MKVDFTYCPQDPHIPHDLRARKETDALRGAVRYLRRVMEEDRPGGKLARKITRTLSRLTRHLFDIEKFNFSVKMKFEMLHDAAWRARVTEDLGGEPALTAWDKARAKADGTVFEPPRCDPEKVRRERCARYLAASEAREAAPEPARAITRKIKTDRDGLFRLAPIRRTIRPLTLQEQWAREEAKTWRGVYKVKRAKKHKPTPAQSFQPIPVTPDELRGHATKRTDCRSWEEIDAMEAMEAEQERIWFETLINASEPQHIKLRSSPRKRGPQVNTTEIPHQVWDERDYELNTNPRAGP